MKTFLTSASVSLALVLSGSMVGAQTSEPVGSAPTVPTQDVPPQDAPPTPQGVWRAPSPLAPGELAQPRVMAYDSEGVPLGVAAMPVAAPTTCEDREVAGRIVAEVFTSAAGFTATGMLLAFSFQSTNSGGAFAVGIIAALTTYFAFTPLAVHGVARNFGGNGKVWAALLGGMLLPVVGHVLGYELSHDNICPPRRTAHPRRLVPPLALREASGLRVMPDVSPLSQGGGTIGVTVAF